MGRYGVSGERTDELKSRFDQDVVELPDHGYFDEEDLPSTVSWGAFPSILLPCQCADFLLDDGALLESARVLKRLSDPSTRQ